MMSSISLDFPGLPSAYLPCTIESLQAYINDVHLFLFSHLARSLSRGHPNRLALHATSSALFSEGFGAPEDESPVIELWWNYFDLLGVSERHLRLSGETDMNSEGDRDPLRQLLTTRTLPVSD